MMVRHLRRLSLIFHLEINFLEGAKTKKYYIGLARFIQSYGEFINGNHVEKGYHIILFEKV